VPSPVPTLVRATLWTRLLSFVLSLTVLLLAVAPVLATSISTDLWVYQQGDTVNVTGDGFDASENVEIVTTDPNAVEVDRGTVLSDANGNIAYSFVLNSDVPGIYDVVATGLSSGLSAATQFDPAVATVTPSSKNYGSVTVGSTSAQVFTLQNTGTTVMSAIAITISGADPSEFVLNSSGTATSLAAGISTTFTITFTPTSAGGKSASATVQSNANPDPVISLSGIGATADGTAPVGTVSINSGATYTNTTAVSLRLQATDAVGVTGYRFANGSDCSGAGAFTAVASTTSLDVSVAHSLTAGDGTKTVCAQFTDAAGNISGNANDTIILDATNPVITGSASPAPNGNGWNNTDVTVTFTCSDGSGPGILTDTVAGAVLTSEGAGQSVSNTGVCIDLAGNPADGASVSGINIDKTAPLISDDGATTSPNVNGWYKTNVTNDFSVDAGISGPNAACALAFPSNAQSKTTSGEGFAVTVTSDGCTDLAGNAAVGLSSAGFQIDKTAPNVSLVGGPADGASYFFGFVPAAPTCSASDGLSGLDGSCNVSGYSALVGTHTVTASALDKAGNSNSDSHTYHVDNWKINGFYYPVDMPTLTNPFLYNSIKGGQTVPLKFEAFAGTVELTDPAFVVPLGTGFSAQQITCNANPTLDPIELTNTGATSLRYDSVSGQFIQNWKTPNGANKCYTATMTFADGQKLIAMFMTK
jgi:hypothetical protein